MASADAAVQQHTLYVNNLNEKLKKGLLKKSLVAAFSPFGRVVDVVAMRGDRMRGQAWVVFDDPAHATVALNKMQGFPFFGKNMRIAFAKKKSDFIAKRDGTYRPREAHGGVKDEAAAGPVEAAQAAAPDEGTAAQGTAQTGRKRAREEQGAEAPVKKRANVGAPNKTLFAEDLPAECNEFTLRMLFRSYRGFVEVRVVPERRVAFIDFEDEAHAGIALGALQGFSLTDTADLSLSYLPR